MEIPRLDEWSSKVGVDYNGRIITHPSNRASPYRRGERGADGRTGAQEVFPGGILSEGEVCCYGGPGGGAPTLREAGLRDDPGTTVAIKPGHEKHGRTRGGPTTRLVAYLVRRSFAISSTLLTTSSSPSTGVEPPSPSPRDRPLPQRLHPEAPGRQSWNPGQRPGDREAGRRRRVGIRLAFYLGQQRETTRGRFQPTTLHPTNRDLQ